MGTPELRSSMALGLDRGLVKRESLCEESLKVINKETTKSRKLFGAREDERELRRNGMCVYVCELIEEVAAVERESAINWEVQTRNRRKRKKKVAIRRKEPGCPHTISLPAPHQTIGQRADNNQVMTWHRSDMWTDWLTCCLLDAIMMKWENQFWDWYTARFKWCHTTARPVLFLFFNRTASCLGAQGSNGATTDRNSRVAIREAGEKAREERIILD